jgi:hypothetical protein
LFGSLLNRLVSLPARLTFADNSENLFASLLTIGGHLAEDAEDTDGLTFLQVVLDRSQGRTACGVEHGVDPLGAVAAVLTNEAYELTVLHGSDPAPPDPDPDPGAAEWNRSALGLPERQPKHRP